MTFDPMRDRDLDPRMNDPRLNPDLRTGYGASSMWGWIAGLAVLVLLLVFLFGSGTENVQTTQNMPSPPMTRNMTPPIIPATPSTIAPQPPETSGQAPAQQ